jgi:hypothetical protein
VYIKSYKNTVSARSISLDSTLKTRESSVESEELRSYKSVDLLKCEERGLISNEGYKQATTFCKKTVDEGRRQ